MTRSEAHELLDAAKAGCIVSERGITEALRATGDLSALRAASSEPSEPPNEAAAIPPIEPPAVQARLCRAEPKPGTLKAAIKAALLAGNRLGMSHADLVALGIGTPRSLSATLTSMRCGGEVAVHGVNHGCRYFVDRASLEAARDELEAHLRAEAEQRMAVSKKNEKARRARYDANRRARKAALPKPPKPPKVKAETRINRAFVASTPKPKAITPAQAWAKAEPVIPPNVKVTHCPGYQADRWRVQAPADGFAAMGVGRYLEAA